MKKLLLLTIAALMSICSVMAQLQFGNGWQTGSENVTYTDADVINIHIAGTTQDQYDRLHLSSGTLTAGNASLNLIVCQPSVTGDRFIIFRAPTIDGEFSNPPLIDAGSNFFALSYEKENGDDVVVLTAVAKLFGLGISTIGAEPLTSDYSYTLNVLAEPTEGGTVSPTQATFSVCDAIDIEATANEGYHFSHWTQEGGAIIDDTEASATTATMPTRDVTITANFCKFPEAPTATAATGVSSNTFIANWEAVTGIVTYTLDVALDDEFDPILESFIVSVGTLSQTVSVFCTATYFYRVKAIDDCGTSDYSATVSVTATATLIDIDGNVYNTVLIGNQCWMAENLKTTKFRNTESIVYPGTDNNAWQTNTSGAYAWHNNDNSWKDSYGALYNWHAVNSPNGLCPTGWYVPSDSEWTQLVDYVVSQGYPNSPDNPNGAGNALKSCRQVDSPQGGDCNTTEHPRWGSHSTHYGFDAFGFSALPGGYRNTSGVFENFMSVGYWWSSTDSGVHPWRRRLSKYFGAFERNGLGKASGFSIRCLKD